MFSLRTALLLVIALGIGITAGLLTLFATPRKNVPAAILAGGAATGSTLMVANTLLGS